jgi:LuxR family maltose regulon positive regulatory protein
MCAAERAAWCLAADQAERGLAVLHDLRVAGEPPPPPVVEDRLRAVEARLWLERGDPNRAEAAIGSDAEEAELGACLSAAAVRVATARGDLDRAAERMASWTNHPSDLKGEIERDLWTAILAAEEGERAAPVERIVRQVLPAVVQEGHRRVVLDAGDLGERALRAVARKAPSREVEGLLQSFDSRRAVIGGAAAGLSDRELEILRYLPTDLSSAEIAEQLYISLNTLKTHLRTIYRKLEVGGRRQAIQRATELGIA